MNTECFSAEQVSQFEQPLDSRLVSEREGSGKMKFKYLKGHDAISQANKLFGYGMWGFEPLSCKQEVFTDPLTNEPVGVAYKAVVRLEVRGCEPVTEIGMHPVVAWNVQEVVLGRRKPGDTGPIKEWEATAARRTIMESHEMAAKGAVIDALKRALRIYGKQFGNGINALAQKAS